MGNRLALTRQFSRQSRAMKTRHRFADPLELSVAVADIAGVRRPDLVFLAALDPLWTAGRLAVLVAGAVFALEAQLLAGLASVGDLHRLHPLNVRKTKISEIPND